MLEFTKVITAKRGAALKSGLDSEGKPIKIDNPAGGKPSMRSLATIGLAMVLLSCTESQQSYPAVDLAAADCSSDSGTTYICGLMNAEDLIRVGGSDLIVTTGMASSALTTDEEINGHIYLIDTNDDSWEDLVSKPTFTQELNDTLYPDCPGPLNVQNFSAHGLALKAKETDLYDLFITSHGGREAIEMFELNPSSGSASLKWVGCVPLDEAIMHNSVAILADGGFVTTQFMIWSEGLESVRSGNARGSVIEWHPGEEPSVMGGTELSGPNGITISDDERYMYVAAIGTRTIARFDRARGNELAVSKALDSNPDNLRWGRAGKLLTAGANSSGSGWSVVEIDSETLEFNRVGGMANDAALQNASAAIEINNKIWVGTFNGNRIGYFQRK